jgi:predicted transcriptional regulator YdeE
MKSASILLISTLISLAQSAPPRVTIEHLEKPFYVAGYLVRTNNAAEMGGQGKIGPLWQRFIGEKLARQIPNRTDDALTVVYSNYASDEQGAYDYLLGARVISLGNLPAGMVSIKVAPGKYAVILTEKGAMPEVLQATWAKIWKMSPAETGGKRSFITDYETYDQRNADPSRTQVEIHLGVRGEQ